MFKFKEMLLTLCLILSGALCYSYGNAITLRTESSKEANCND